MDDKHQELSRESGPPRGENMIRAAARARIPHEIDDCDQTDVSSITTNIVAQSSLYSGLAAMAMEAGEEDDAMDHQRQAWDAKQALIRDLNTKTTNRKSALTAVGVPVGATRVVGEGKTAVGIPLDGIDRIKAGVGVPLKEAKDRVSWKTPTGAGHSSSGLHEDATELPLPSEGISDAPEDEDEEGRRFDHSEEPESDDSEPEMAVVEGAVLVTNDAEVRAVRRNEVFEGRISEEPTGMQNRGKPGVAMGLACLLFAGFFVFLGVLLRPFSTDSSPTGNEDLVLSVGGIPPPFWDGLPGGIALKTQDTASPYYAANVWAVNDPNRSAYSENQQLERFHLAAFYYFTNGQNWIRRDHWLSYEISHCHWYSSSMLEPVCDDWGSFIALNLSSNNLQGEFTHISDQQIDHLRIFDISNNSMSGNPPRVGHIRSLEVLDISNNNFTTLLSTGGGTFLSSRIRVFRTNNNGLFNAGDETSNNLFFLLLPHLEVFNNSANLFYNRLSRDMSLCKNLTSYSSKNNHVGSIPSEYGRLAKLQVFDLEGNHRMDGSIPSELGLWGQLTSLDISGTAITGTIPEQLCARAQAGLLDIFANCSLVNCCA